MAQLFPVKVNFHSQITVKPKEATAHEWFFLSFQVF